MKTYLQITLQIANKNSDLFSNDVVGELGPLLDAKPEIRIYEAH